MTEVFDAFCKVWLQLDLPFDLQRWTMLYQDEVEVGFRDCHSRDQRQGPSPDP